MDSGRNTGSVRKSQSIDSTEERNGEKKSNGGRGPGQLYGQGDRTLIKKGIFTQKVLKPILEWGGFDYNYGAELESRAEPLQDNMKKGSLGDSGGRTDRTIRRGHDCKNFGENKPGKAK